MGNSRRNLLVFIGMGRKRGGGGGVHLCRRDGGTSGVRAARRFAMDHHLQFDCARRGVNYLQPPVVGLTLAIRSKWQPCSHPSRERSEGWGTRPFDHPFSPRQIALSQAISAVLAPLSGLRCGACLPVRRSRIFETPLPIPSLSNPQCHQRSG